MKKSEVRFNASYLRETLLKKLEEEQTKRLTLFAEAEIKKLGDKIQTYHSRHHMDRTGNLLNSLCWGVSFNGKLAASGFYRDAVTHSRGRDGSSVSWLHEFFSETGDVVDGRRLAEEFIESKKNGGKEKGWNMFVAVLAPYWGYWESGFTMKGGGGFNPESGTTFARFTRRLQFQVMTHIFDDVRIGLKPAKTHFSVYVPKYQYRNKKYKNKVGHKKYTLNKMWRGK